MLKKLLAHPLTRGLDINAPHTTALRREIIQSKPFLKQIYLEWYEYVLAALDGTPQGVVLEIGSGAGFLEQFIPGLITSDILYVPFNQLVLDGCSLPFPDNSLDSIVMTNVLHHIPYAGKFLQETARCLRIGGALVMLEPWVSAWSHFVYKYIHHEHYDPNSPEWDFPTGGPLSDANSALPWIVFERDRDQFERQYPQLEISQITPFMPVRYMLSGGISMRCLMPFCLYGFWRWIEERLTPLNRHLGMHALIKVTKIS